MITHSLKLFSLLCTSSMIVLFIGVVSDSAHALQSYLTQYNTAYGTAATCSVCHTSPPTLNATGNAFLNSGHNLASIAPSGNSTASSPTTPTSPSAPSSPAQTTNPANPKTPRNPRQTTSSNPNPSPGVTNNTTSGTTGWVPGSSAGQTPSETVQNNPTPGSASENTSSPGATGNEGAGSWVRGPHSPSTPRAEGNRTSRPNMQFRPPPRIRR